MDKIFTVCLLGLLVDTDEGIAAVASSLVVKTLLLKILFTEVGVLGRSGKGVGHTEEPLFSYLFRIVT